MAIWARMQDGIVLETTEIDPEGRFHPSIEWREAPDGVVTGMTLDGDAYREPAAPTLPPAPRSVPLSAIRTRLGEAGLWTAFAHALEGLPPEKRYDLLAMAGGLASDDPNVLALLAAIGADPAAIMSAPNSNE